MAAAEIFRIEGGVFALLLVDTAAVGYDPADQTPGGVEVDTITPAAYAGAAGSGISFECQTTSAALVASANTTDDTTPATFCQPETTTTSVGVTSYTLDASILQDPHISDGISAYLFEHDTKAAYFYLGLADADAPPKAVGIVRLVAGQIGGEVRVTLTADISLPVERKPDLWVGNATTNRVIHGDGSAVTTFNAPPEARAKKATSDAS